MFLDYREVLPMSVQRTDRSILALLQFDIFTTHVDLQNASRAAILRLAQTQTPEQDCKVVSDLLRYSRSEENGKRFADTVDFIYSVLGVDRVASALFLAMRSDSLPSFAKTQAVTDLFNLGEAAIDVFEANFIRAAKEAIIPRTNGSYKVFLSNPGEIFSKMASLGQLERLVRITKECGLQMAECEATRINQSSITGALVAALATFGQAAEGPLFQALLEGECQNRSTLSYALASCSQSDAVSAYFLERMRMGEVEGTIALGMFSKVPAQVIETAISLAETNFQLLKELNKPPVNWLEKQAERDRYRQILRALCSVLARAGESDREKARVCLQGMVELNDSIGVKEALKALDQADPNLPVADLWALDPDLYSLTLLESRGPEGVEYVKNILNEIASPAAA